MITLVYYIKPEDKEAEREWLSDQKIFPAFELAWDWVKGKEVMKVGMIVSPETALSIKLRHQNIFQQEYTQR